MKRSPKPLAANYANGKLWLICLLACRRFCRIFSFLALLYTCIVPLTVCRSSPLRMHTRSSPTRFGGRTTKHVAQLDVASFRCAARIGGAKRKELLGGLFQCGNCVRLARHLRQEALI